MERLPDEAVELARGGRAVELAAGRRFDVALELAARAGCRVFVMDRDPLVLLAPAPLVAFTDDLTAPDLPRYEGAALLFARRLPEELQGPAARLARAVGAPLWFKPLKDELADVGPLRLVAGWRVLNA